MPLPPPPAVAFKIIGYPTLCANSITSSGVFTIPVPGVTGTLFSIIVLRAVALSPILRIALAVGPMNLILYISQISANSALSDKKPYPGWIASQPAIKAVDIIVGILR